MDEDFEAELYQQPEMYEEPDYNVWETNRVYEDMAIERAEAEAEAEAEVEAAKRAELTRIVKAAVEHREWDDFAPIWSDVVEEVVDALRKANVEPDPNELRRKQSCDHPEDVPGCSECDWAMGRR